MERQREGIACAKQKGVYRGRKPKEFDVKILSEVLADIEQKEMTVNELEKSSYQDQNSDIHIAIQIQEIPQKFDK